jgi:tetratricopeptide (TPR) repeat protein
MTSTEPVILGRRYILQKPLGTGGMGAVYLATDRLTGSPVALKRVIQSGEVLDTASTGDSKDYRLALAGEFKVLASLRHPNIISVIDYGFDDERHPYYTMELLEDAQTILEAGREKSLTERAGLLVQMLQALAYLHRRGVIHRDLKPRNVLVANGQVKVLDFGLSIHDGAPSDHVGTAGTLAYMAPEILAGGVPNESADLYAVGIMAYELFVGKHPYMTDDLTALLNNMLYAYPDMSPLAEHTSLMLVVERLLAKTREARYSSVREVIVELSEALDQPLPLETAATRESFLQAAKLVGRDAELQKLSEALEDAIDGQGSAWLVGGESGVGKSRVLEELRALALVRGALVLRGQGVSEGGSPYFLWRPALRWLALLSELDDADLAVLKGIIPDLNTLLGREIPDPDTGERDPQKRMMKVIEDLFRAQKVPMVAILEDLHWSNESLDVLARLNQIVSELPLLIVGSYRDDERPELPKRLPGMNVMRLERLDEVAIAQLSEAMLGESGKQPEVVDLLQRETEGNVFFLVEVVRALAEEAGTLERIGMATLPAQVFAGGVQQIIARRLGQVPRDARSLLRVAAVMGRQFDLAVLRAIEPERDLDNWLSVCSDAAVLEVHDGEWRFTHDKLRDGVLAELTPEDRKMLHGQIAAAMEKLHGDDPVRYQILAYHYGHAGNATKEAHFTTLAGGQCLRSGAYRDAINFFQRTLDITTLTPDADGFALKIQQMALKRLIAEAHLGLGEYGRARALYLENLGTCLALAYRRGVAESLISLGDIASALGEFDEAKRQYQESLDIYRELDEQDGIARALNCLGNVAYETGAVDEARRLFQESLTLSRGVSGTWGMAGAMSASGAGGDAEYNRAKNELREAINAYAVSLMNRDNRLALVGAFQKLMAVTDKPSEYPITRALLQDHLTYFQQTGDTWGAGLTMINLGRVAGLAGDYDDARKTLYASLKTANDTHEIPLALGALLEIGRLFIFNDQKPQAVELLSLVLHHPEAPEVVEDEAERLLFELESDMDAGVMSVNWEKGKTGNLDSAVNHLLADVRPS